MPTQADQQAANSDEQAANGGEQFAAQWLTVAEVADSLNVTPRTIQKRCKAGKLDARSVETPTGDQWQINAVSVETQGTKAANEATNRAANSREQAANRSQPQSDAAPDFRARYIAQIEAENSFLKSQLEDANRNAAELRASLREALRAMPKQLTAAPDDAATPPSLTAEMAQERAQIGKANNVFDDHQATRKSPPTRTPRALWRILLGIR